MHLTPRLEPPPLHSPALPLNRLPHQSHHLPLPPRSQRTHHAIKHHHKRHHGDHIRPKQQLPVPPKPIPAPEHQERPHGADRKQAPQIPALELEDGEAVARRDRVLEDTASEGVGEVVEGEVEETEDFFPSVVVVVLLLLLLRVVVMLPVARPEENVAETMG